MSSSEPERRGTPLPLSFEHHFTFCQSAARFARETDVEGRVGDGRKFYVVNQFSQFTDCLQIIATKPNSGEEGPYGGLHHREIEREEKHVFQAAVERGTDPGAVLAQKTTD